MVAILTVPDWYRAGKPFGSGCALLLALGGSLDGLEKWRQQPIAPPYPSDLLEKRLLALRHMAEAVPDSEKPGSNARFVGNFGNHPVVEEPDIILQLREQGRILLKERAAVHGQMTGSKDERFRADCAHKIMADLQPRIDDTYAVLRRWEKDGTMPIVSTASVVIAAKNDLQKLLSLRARVSKIRKTLRDGGISSEREKQLRDELSLKVAAIQTLENQ